MDREVDALHGDPDALLHTAPRDGPGTPRDRGWVGVGRGGRTRRGQVSPRKGGERSSRVRPPGTPVSRTPSSIQLVLSVVWVVSLDRGGVTGES